jgi:hypothetical protein
MHKPLQIKGFWAVRVGRLTAVRLEFSGIRAGVIDLRASAKPRIPAHQMHHRRQEYPQWKYAQQPDYQQRPKAQLSWSKGNRQCGQNCNDQNTSVECNRVLVWLAKQDHQEDLQHYGGYDSSGDMGFLRDNGFHLGFLSFEGLV